MTDVRLERPVTCDQLRAFLAGLDTMIDPGKLRDDTRFTDAGADSLDFFNVLTSIHAATGVEIPDQDVPLVNTLAGLAAYLTDRMA